MEENQWKKISGITLITLTITIIVLIILASITLYSGLSTVRNSKFLRFRTQLEIIQAQVDMLNEKYEKQIEEAENNGTYFSEIGKDLSTISIEGEPENSFNGANVLDETEKNKYRY